MEDSRPELRRGGVFDSILIFLAYLFTTIFLRAPFRGVTSLVVDCILRIVFGTAALLLFVKRFQKGKWSNVIHFRNFKAGLPAATGILLLTLFTILQIAAGAKSVEISAQIIFADIFLLQITTGYWEEMVFRAYLMEGYYSGLSAEERTWKQRLYYSVVSALIFGALHIPGGSLLLVVFCMGFGFICASVYLYSHNILVCMLLHFVYDVFANLRGYAVEWDETSLLFLWNDPIFLILTGVGCLIAVVYLIKEPVDEKRPSVRSQEYLD